MSSLKATLVALALAVVPATAQQPLLSENKQASLPVLSMDMRLPSIPVPGCQGLAVSDLTFHSRACYQAKRLIATSGMLRSLAQSSFAEWVTNPHGYFRGENEFSHHLEYFYSRRAANDIGELIVGSLNHEPIQPDPSRETGLWKRSQFALLSVVAIREGNSWRPALAPAAGSLASGFVTLGCCAVRGNATDALRRSAITYAGYFATAIFREFKPELKAYARRRLRQ